MEDKNRRSFLGKLLFGAGAVAAWPILSAANKKEEEMNTKAILKVRALGFQWETKDPFLFCVHHEDQYPKGNDQLGPDASLDGRQIGQDFMLKDGWRMYHGTKVPGFPGHPHRGFETLTVVRKGFVDHSDSSGASGRYGEGDLQWMSAGKGLMHSEMFPLLSKDQDNPLELFQIWLNLPKKEKMSNPDFKMFWHENIPQFHIEDNSIYVEIMAGKLFEKSSPKPPSVSWASQEENHVGVFNFHMEKDAAFTLPKTAPGVNRSIYFYEGDALNIESEDIPKYHAIDVDPEQDIFIKNTSENTAKILVLQGKPINEPVVQHGPFVMNSRQEIQDAFRDYQETQFGGWPWPEYDNVHDKSKGRFAIYADGTKETPKS